MTTIRIYYVRPSGELEDSRHEFALSDFGGVLPSIGDEILDPGVFSGLDRSDPDHRRLWKVVRRIFNPKDNADYILLVVEETRVVDADKAIV